MNWSVTLGGNVFNSLDVVIFAIMMIGAVGGVLVGFIESFSRSAGYVLGTLAGLMFTVPVADLCMKSLGLSLFASSLCSFVCLFLLAFVLVRMLAGILQKVIDLSTGLEVVDRLLGFFWGMLVVFLCIALICYALRSQKLVNVDPLFDASQFITRVIDPNLPTALRAIKGRLS